MRLRDQLKINLLKSIIILLQCWIKKKMDTKLDQKWIQKLDTKLDQKWIQKLNSKIGFSFDYSIGFKNGFSY